MKTISIELLVGLDILRDPVKKLEDRGLERSKVPPPPLSKEDEAGVRKALKDLDDLVGVDVLTDWGL